MPLWPTKGTSFTDKADLRLASHHARKDPSLRITNNHRSVPATKSRRTVNPQSPADSMQVRLCNVFTHDSELLRRQHLAPGDACNQLLRVHSHGPCRQSFVRPRSFRLDLKCGLNVRPTRSWSASLPPDRSAASSAPGPAYCMARFAGKPYGASDARPGSMVVRREAELGPASSHGIDATNVPPFI